MARKKVNRIQVNMHEAKTRLSQLAEAAWSGDEVVIARAGKPYLDLKPHVVRARTDLHQSDILGFLSHCVCVVLACRSA